MKSEVGSQKSEVRSWKLEVGRLPSAFVSLSFRVLKFIRLLSKGLKKGRFDERFSLDRRQAW